MPAAARSSGKCAKMQTTLSAWTPLNDPLFNNKVFEERRILLAKWSNRWSDSQRREVLQDLVLSCSPQQLRFLSLSVSRRLPLQAADFTCLLPRALCLYLFSFLDPRSLCRCARVSWHWRSIVELDQLWMPKCLRLGWCISFSPTPFEQGVWKRHYIQTVQELRLKFLQQRVAPPARSSRLEDLEAKPDAAPPREERAACKSRPQRGVPRKKQSAAPPPWRDADRHPKDTVRFNYLDNLDMTGQTLRGQVSIRGSAHHGNTWTPDDGANRTTPTETNYKLRKAKSLMFLTSNCRAPNPSSSPPPLPPPPHHPCGTRSGPALSSHDLPITKDAAESRLRMSSWGAVIPSGPVRSAVLRASQRSYRSPPSKPLFEALPWTVHTQEKQSEAHRPRQEEARTTT